MEQGSINGWTALVTGASSGVGLAISHALAKEGVNLCLVARNEAKVTNVAKQLQNVKTLPIGIDLTHGENTKIVIDKCVQHFGGINILVNAAAVYASSGDPIEHWERCINLDLITVMRMCKLSLQHLEKQANSIIINLASIAGRHEFRGSAPYIAAKHGVVGFSLALFEDVRDKNVKVITIEPGWTNSPMTEKIRPGGDKKQMVQTEDIAKSVVFACKFPPNACPVELTIMPQHHPQPIASA